MTKHAVSGMLAVLPLCVAGFFAQAASAQVDTTPLPDLHPTAHLVISERSNYGGGVNTKQHVFPLAMSAASKVNGPAMYLGGAMAGTNWDFRGWAAAEGELYDAYLSDENGTPQENGYCTSIDLVWRGYPVGNPTHRGGHLFDVHIRDGDPTTGASTNEIARFDDVATFTHALDGEPGRNENALLPGSGVYSTVTVLGRMPVGSTEPMSITLCRSQVSEWVGNQRGMTFGLQAQQAPGTGTLHVGCPGGDGYDCKPQIGDKPCGASLPMACFRPDGPPHPAGVPVSSPYHEWAGGTLEWLPAMPAPTTLSEANGACQGAFGSDWRVAEFHDGWGWHFWAYGDQPDWLDDDARFWVDIDDQANGVCWDRTQ